MKLELSVKFTLQITEGFSQTRGLNPIRRLFVLEKSEDYNYCKHKCKILINLIFKH